MKKFIFISAVLVLAMTACETNTSAPISEPNPFVDETVTVVNDPLTIYKEHRDSLLTYGTGKVYPILIKYPTSKWDITTEYSTVDLYIKSHETVYEYNMNTKQWYKGAYKDNPFDTIILFKDKETMKAVVSGALKMINNGYINKVAADDFEDFPILDKYELRIERGGSQPSYTLYNDCPLPRASESAAVTKSILQNILKELS